MEYPALVTLIALFEYMTFTFRVGMSRDQFGVEAPATSGHPEWERLFRGQQNTLEQLMIFLPALWLFSIYVDPKLGAGIGVLFLIGRPLYVRSYAKDPTTRTTGFLMGFFSIAILMLGSVYGVVRNLL